MKTTSRRSFLATAGTLVAAAAAAPLAAMRPPASPASGQGHAPAPSTWIKNQPQYQTVVLYQFTPELFQPLVGTPFQVVDSQGQRATLRLLAVKDLRQQNPGSKTAFALQFRMLAGKPLPQGTYQFTTPPLGTFLLFVVPSAPVRNASYTAIINRI